MAGRDFDAVYDRLRAILAPYVERMHVSPDSEREFGVDLAP